MNDLKIRMYELRTGYHVVCYRDPVTQKRKRRKFAVRSEAKTYFRDLEFQLSSKGKSSFNATPVNELMKFHLDRIPDSRVLERKTHFRSFCEHFGHRPVNQVTKTELISWFAMIKEKDDLSDRTLNSIKSSMNSFFKFLEDEGVISDSPLSKIRFDRRPQVRRPRVVLSVEEVHKILADLNVFCPRVLYPIVFIVAYTGARRSEVLRLKRSDVDLVGGLIHFRQTKNGEDRSIRIGKSLRAFLEEHLSSHGSEWVCSDERGRMMPRSILQRRIRRFKKTFPNGKKWGLHSLRHSFAYNFLKKGGNMYQLQAILGHKSIDVTIDIYGQIGAQDVENACPYEIEE